MSSAADDALMAELSALTTRSDPMPASLGAAVRGAIGWRTPGARVADVTHDSALDDTRGAVRSGQTAERLLTFEAVGATIELEVRRSGATRSIVGQVIPPGDVAVSLRHLRGEVSAPIDDLGRFAFDGVPAGPVSIRCVSAGGSGAGEIVTAWVPI